MRKVLFFLSLVALLPTVTAQTAKVEIAKNVRITANRNMAYMIPKKQQTPAPPGMKPFYVSHFGRCGSHYLDEATDYDYPYNTLLRAASLGKLTPMGRTALQRIQRIRDDARERLGELTPLGHEQQKQIARRMYERFPEVFTGDAHIDARSTLSVRSILSMESMLQQLLTLNPKLQVCHDATRRDQYYMSPTDTLFTLHATEPSVTEPYQEFCKRHDTSDKLMKLLFSDADYVRSEVDASRFNVSFFKLASHLQNTDLSNRLTLYDTFSDDDLYENWLCDNALSYVTYASSPLNGGRQPFVQRELLRQIIYEADSCVSNGKPCATLRFGHDSAVLSLACLLDLNDCGQQIADLDQLDRKGWHDYKLNPMAANIQFVFYHRMQNDGDVYFKVLLNEEEAALPLKSIKGAYYHWNEFRERYLKLLNSYREP